MQPFEFLGDWSGQLIATSIHAGHDLSPEIARSMVLDEEVRFREEDPFTDLIAGRIPARVNVHLSRFETDLNRIRTKAVYRTPDDCWGLKVWDTDELPEDAVDIALAGYDAFYAALAERLDVVAERGPFVIYDVHSYNHRRDGADAPDEPVEDNPEVNLGTGSLNHETFGDVAGAFRESMLGQGFDIRENVKFKGQNLAWFVHERYPGVGCVLAIEFKKTFMDEWTGEPDQQHIERLAAALEQTQGPVLAALAEIPERHIPQHRDPEQAMAGEGG
ncbi:N-formylglutamate amidohydrolase [Tessaracoccus sp. ZS01]|uniref:N-formylglutamate amidohydrolase n=1 Tax=Tessaracoccus sp. ZS01 TaxID=1906324 RepID=UPI00096D5185|nr:N-formylglutamate amidohydrolase [Tessaracoccus sp. ZS01]MCG6568273.1 N-formylglutamate amidohydrolase [Tessaracoccus sp. ZS01]OMG53364.1 N-formylglutamate amidohydrolase [Tessaracoccus sp. ZS01]